MRPQSHDFVARAAAARRDPTLMGALARLQRDSRASRLAVRTRLPEFDALRDAAVAIKDHTLANLDLYLEAFESKVVEAGGRVHWCRTAAEARETILAVCQARNARRVAKGKSMASEEIALNEHLVRHGLEVIETDLGEYILQLRAEPPSHIVMPAIHLTRAQIADTFRAHHADLSADRQMSDARALTDEARERLRAKFLAADVGITGANFLVAQTGSAVVVTNEGNGDLSHTLPRVHIVLAGIEKVVPRPEDAFALIRLLARSATGQEITSYTSFVTGPRRGDEPDGPEEFHVVLIDNGRSALLGGRLQEVLRCIRCGACQSLCPVYGAVGGHAYGWVYGGPIGAVISPALVGLPEARHLPEASTFCGACADACPVRIPLPDLMRHWREEAHAHRLSSGAARAALAAWAVAARRPRLYRALSRVAIAAMSRLAPRSGRFRRLPFARAWTAGRDFPAPEGGTFFARWKGR
jgi:L-lactate dehydrogenase complex protein LldF